MLRQLQAEQYRRIQRALDHAAVIEGVGESSTAGERDMATRSFVAELATLLGRHEASASRLVAEAARLTGPRRATLAALEAGELSLTQVRSVLELTQGLPAEVADAVESEAVDGAAAAGARGVVTANADLRRRMRRVRERMHPESLGDRRARAAAERRVCLEPAPDGMAWLSLFLEAERAVAIDARLGVLAGREASDDGRTTAQRAADLAADLLLGGVLSDGERTRSGAAGATGAVRPCINVTVPVLTLLGRDDEPADLEGYGPIDADTARRLAAHARRCGASSCTPRSAPRSADLDHTVDWARGGATSAANLAVLCRHHHRLKHESGWRVAQEPGGVMRWTSPIGHVLRTLPERPFVPVGGGEGVDPIGDARSSDPPSPPPERADPIDDELRCLLEHDAEPAPF